MNLWEIEPVYFFMVGPIYGLIVISFLWSIWKDKR